MRHRRLKVKQIWKDRLPLTRPDCLTGLEWTVLRLHVDENVSDRQIAEKLKISEGDVREVRRGASLILLCDYAFNSKMNDKMEKESD